MKRSYQNYHTPHLNVQRAVGSANQFSEGKHHTL